MMSYTQDRTVSKISKCITNILLFNEFSYFLQIKVNLKLVKKAAKKLIRGILPKFWYKITLSIL